MDSSGPYIMVVDDMADSADTLSELLSIWGYEAEPHYSGVAALEAACARRPDAVLLDLGMPGMTGFQLALRLRDLPGCGATPLVAVTGHAALKLQAREVGIDHYLLKPVLDFCFLRELLGRVIAIAELSHSQAQTDPKETGYGAITQEGACPCVTR